MPNSNPENRRVGDRQAIELKVEYKRLNTFFADYTRNISKGGTFIRTDKPLDIGTEFVFALAIPQLEEPVRLRGRVIWVVDTLHATTDSPPGMGIRFQYTGSDERVAIERVVERLMRGQLGDRLSEKLLGRKPHEDPESEPEGQGVVDDTLAGSENDLGDD